MIYIRDTGRFQIFEVLMAFFGAAPPFDLEILGVLNGNSLPILRNIRV